MAPTPIPLSPRRLAPSGLRLHPSESAFREGSATIVLPTSSAAFLNPVQEFNRDLSILSIRSWSEMMDEDLKRKWDAKMARRKGKENPSRGARGGKKRALAGNGDEQGDAVNGHAVENDVKRSKGENGGVMHVTTTTTDATQEQDKAVPETSKSQLPEYRPFNFTLLEALAATGLRSIRYAREIPLLRQVVANDLSTSAVKAMKRNIALNFPADRPIEEWIPGTVEEEAADADRKATDEDELDEDALMELENNGMRKTSETSDGVGETTTEPAPSASSMPAAASLSADEEASAVEAAIHPQCRIKINQGDAMDVMYSHRQPGSRYDVIDLDPYGTAAPFLDGAVQSVADGGLLCVTCTDSAVLASNSYPEKAFSLYGGSCTRSEFSHEIALRLVVHAISSAAARYGRYIQPLLSLSIDFYVRLFVSVHTGPQEVKKVASKTGITYICSYCGNYHEQRLGRATEQEGKGGKAQKYIKFQNGSGPPSSIQGSKCEECGSQYMIAGPMWLDPIHDPSFCNRVLENVNAAPQRSKTAARIRGMVSTAASELSSPFYFTPGKVAGAMHSTSPPLVNVASALLNAGFSVSRSHCIAGSLKTNASRSQVFDLMRSWIANGHPVNVDKIAEKSPARTLVLKERKEVFDLDTIHEEARKRFGKLGAGSTDGGKSVRYQMNPLPNWGPGTAARMT